MQKLIKPCSDEDDDEFWLRRLTLSEEHISRRHPNSRRLLPLVRVLKCGGPNAHSSATYQTAANTTRPRNKQWR